MQEPVHSTEPPKDQKVQKRPYLTRGSGNAGGKGIQASNQKMQSYPEMEEKRNNREFDSYPDTMKTYQEMVQDFNRNFNEDQPVGKVNNKRKLFQPDSDDEKDNKQPSPRGYDGAEMDNDNRSNLVKKMFYKESDSSSKSNLRLRGAG